MRRHLASLALAAAAAITVAAGCGSDDAGDGGDVAEPGPTATVAAGDQDFCDAFGAIIAGPLNDAGTDFDDPEIVQAAVELTEELLTIVVEGAPPELRAAATTVSDEYGGFFDVLERYGYDRARVAAEATPEEQAVLDGFLAEPAAGAADPFGELEEAFFDRCAAGVTLPQDVLDDLTTTTATSP